MTSSNGNIFRVTGHFCGEFTGPGEFPSQRPVTRSFDVFFDLRLNKRLSKQPWGWWFETPSWLLWRHCNEVIRVAQLQYLCGEVYKSSVWDSNISNFIGISHCITHRRYTSRIWYGWVWDIKIGRPQGWVNNSSVCYNFYIISHGRIA